MKSSIPLLLKRLAVLSGILLPALAGAARPNVLFIVCDDLNTHVSTSGYPHITTPAFDTLAAAGMNFRRAYCQYPVCGPSRASFLSGLYPQSTGVLNNTLDIRKVRPGTVSMPGHFKEAGYWTARVGKIFHNAKTNPGEAWHENPDRFVNDEMRVEKEAREKFTAEHGPINRKNKKKWDEFRWNYATQLRNQHVGYGPTGLTDAQHKDGKNAIQVAKWLDDKAHGDKPFFIACGIQKPHVPYLAPDKYFEMYPREKLVFEPAKKEFWDQAPKMAGTNRWEGFGFEHLVEDDALRREYMQAYHACISFIDAQIGRVLEALKRNGRWEDTIIVLTSDHGYLLGEKFMWGKVMLFETCDRVPLVIRAPEQVGAAATTPGSTSEGLVELVDLFPTLAELCNVKPPSDLQGRSLVPMLKDPSTKGKEAAYTVVSRGEKLGKAIRTQGWRYTEWPDGEELYNLESDSEENKNLARSGRHAATLGMMRSKLKEIEQMASSKRQR